MNLVFQHVLWAPCSLTYLVLAIILIKATGGIKVCFKRVDFSVSSVSHSHIYSSSSHLPLAA